jgi:adenosylcobinamide-GDP ribazoletransferase
MRLFIAVNLPVEIKRSLGSFIQVLRRFPLDARWVTEANLHLTLQFLGNVYEEQVRAALLVTGLIVLTGGIHLDGFMDSIDGLLSGRPRERKLEIMRDSRVGAFGVTGAVCLLLTKYTLILGLPGQSLTWVLITVPVLSRWSMVFAITAFPYARLEGLGKVYAVYAGRKELLIATLIAALVAGLTLNLLGAWLMFAGAAFTYLVCRRISRALGGLTGDIYGFINEMTEVVLLTAVYPYLQLNAGI